ncbi:hypothetical protein HanIR_Chr05g0220301 [Helianthus annuus]|nr:hypothetical protein HanIR_Chr05g0220301 [Helianthus annuus]
MGEFPDIHPAPDCLKSADWDSDNCQSFAAVPVTELKLNLYWNPHPIFFCCHWE